jgi:hypothetical protein
VALKSECELAGFQRADLAAGDVTSGGIGATSGGQLRSHREPPPAKAVQQDPDLVRRPKARSFVSTQRVSQDAVRVGVIVNQP